MTRRSLLRAGAGALAGAALRPAATLAAPDAAPSLRTIDLGILHGERTVALPAGVAVAGLEWRGERGARPQLRVKTAAGAWGPWVAAGAHGHGPDASAPDAPAGEPLWLGGARLAQLRSGAPLADARLRLVLATRAALQGGSAHAAALALAQPVLAAGPGQPPIIARTAWAKGIPPPACRTGLRRRGARLRPPHGEPERLLRRPGARDAPCDLPFHREFNGWNDIGYNFVLDRFGRIWEARAGGIDEPVVGAQAGGYNLVSTGVAVLGSYSGTPVSAAARAALQAAAGLEARAARHAFERAA